MGCDDFRGFLNSRFWRTWRKKRGDGLCDHLDSAVVCKAVVLAHGLSTKHTLFVIPLAIHAVPGGVKGGV